MDKKNPPIKQPLPTLFFPFPNRKYFRAWTRLSNGDYIVDEAITYSNAIRLVKFCKRYGIKCKVEPKNKEFEVGTLLALTLLVFYIG